MRNGPLAAFQVGVERGFQLRQMEQVRVDLAGHHHADAAHARFAGMRTRHLDLFAVVRGHCRASAQGETSASRNAHIDLALQHHADGQAGTLMGGRHIRKAIMDVGGDQAHAAAQELLVDLAMAGPLVVAQVFRVGAVIEAMAVAEAAVISKSEISGHRSARALEVDAGITSPTHSATQMQIRSLPVRHAGKQWHGHSGGWGEHQVELNVSEKMETFPIVASIRALLI